jgi:hypothetical protein
LLGTAGLIPRQQSRAASNISSCRPDAGQKMSHQEDSGSPTERSTKDTFVGYESLLATMKTKVTKGPSEQQKGEDAVSDYEELFATIAKMTEKWAPDPQDYENLFVELHERAAAKSSARSTARDEDDPDL